MTDLELFLSQGEVKITKNPFNNKDRVVKIEKGFYFNPIQKQILLECTIFNLDVNGIKYTDYNSSFCPTNKKLLADDVTKVDINGNIVLKPIFSLVAPIVVNPVNPSPQEAIDLETYQLAYNAYQIELSNYNALKSEYQYVVDIILSKAYDAVNLMIIYIKRRALEGKLDL